MALNFYVYIICNIYTNSKKHPAMPGKDANDEKICSCETNGTPSLRFHAVAHLHGMRPFSLGEGFRFCGSGHFALIGVTFGDGL